MDPHHYYMESLFAKRLLLYKTADGRYIDMFTVPDNSFNSVHDLAILGVKSNKAAAYLHKTAGSAVEQDDHVAAFRLYNAAMSYAENKSHTLSFIYSERSKIFAELKWYDQALVDIELCKKVYPDRHCYMAHEQIYEKKRADLFKRGVTIERRFTPKVERADKQYEPKPLRLKADKNAVQGYCAVARCDFNIGQIVLIEKNYLDVLQPFYDMMQQCMNCGAQFGNLVACRKCIYGMLCNRAECKDAHSMICGLIHCTNDIHRRFRSECEFVIRAIEKGVNLFKTMDAFIKFVEAALAEEPGGPAAINELDPVKKYKSFLRLYRNKVNIGHRRDPILESMFYNFVRQQKFIKIKMKTQQHERFLMHLIAHHAAQYTGYLKCIKSTGIIPHYFTHACVPNIMLHFYNGETHAVALRPIKKNDVLTVSYDFPGCHTNLADHVYAMNIACKCRQCSGDGPKSSTVIDTDEKYDKYIRNRYGWSTLEDVKEALVDAKDMAERFEKHWSTTEYSAIQRFYFQVLATKYRLSLHFVD